MDNTLFIRLSKAKEEINKAFEDDNAEAMGKLAKRIQPLHLDCYTLWADKDFEDDCKEYHYAEHLRLLIMLYFEHLFDYGGSTEGLYEECQVEMWKAGLEKNRITGKYIDEL